MSNYLNKAETNKLIRQVLKATFPGVKFSVKGSAREATYISWTDGPNDAQVSAVTDIFQSSGFDGMKDYQYNIYHTMNGEKITFGTDYIFTRRHVSDEVKQRSIDLIYKNNEQFFNDHNLDKPTLNNYWETLNNGDTDFFRETMNTRLFKLSFVFATPNDLVKSIVVTGNERDDYTKAEEKRANDDLEAKQAKDVQQTIIYTKALTETMTGTIKVTKVEVKYSEFRGLENKEYSFEEFEAIAATVTGSGGFYKTGIEVFFDNGESYALRIDLAPGLTSFLDYMVLRVTALNNDSKAANLLCKNEPDFYNFLATFFRTYNLNAPSYNENNNNVIYLGDNRKYH